MTGSVRLAGPWERGGGCVSCLLEFQPWQLSAAFSCSPAPHKPSQSPMPTGLPAALLRAVDEPSTAHWDATCFPHSSSSGLREARECLRLVPKGRSGCVIQWVPSVLPLRWVCLVLRNLSSSSRRKNIRAALEKMGRYKIKAFSLDWPCKSNYFEILVIKSKS